MTLSPLSVSELSVTLSNTDILDGVTLSLPEKGLSALVGPNGAGKTTLIRAVLGLLPKKAVKGDITFFGKPLDKTHIAYVPQRADLDWTFPLNVMDVALMGCVKTRGFFRAYRTSDKEKALNALDKVGLLQKKDEQIVNLSGGQRQRLLIARALVEEPEFYILDEPLDGVDNQSEKAILALLKEIAPKTPLLCVHHQLETVAKDFDHVVILNHHQAIMAGDPKKTIEAYRKTYA